MAAAKTARHPKCAPMKPANARATRIPVSRPLMTSPMARPRSWAGTSSVANGPACWAMVAKRPSTKLAPVRMVSVGAMTAMSKAAQVPAACKMIRRRRSMRSPSGEISSIPVAKPIWVAAGTAPTQEASPGNDARISVNSGWLK